MKELDTVTQLIDDMSHLVQGVGMVIILLLQNYFHQSKIFQKYFILYQEIKDWQSEQFEE